MMKTTTTSEILPKGSVISDAVKGSQSIRWLRLLLFSVALALPKLADAVVVTIAGPVAGSTCPTCTYDYYGYSGIGGTAHNIGADIYGKDEMGTVGKITTMALQKTSGSTSAVIDSVYIFMKETPDTKITSPISMAGYKEVFRGTYPNTVSSGWMAVTLSTPFDYTGTGNLSVLIVRRGSSSFSNQYFQNHYVYGSVYQTGYYTSSSSSWSSWLTSAASSTIYTNSYRLNIQFNVDPFDPCTGTPTAGTAVASTTTACPGKPVIFTLTGSTLASSITYEWDTSATGASGWALAGTTTTVPGKWTFTPPGNRTLYYRCRATCSAGGTTATSSTVSVAVSGYTPIPYSEDFEGATPGVNVPCAAVSGTFTPGVGSYYGYDWDLKSGTHPSYPALTNHTPSGSKYIWGGAYVGTYNTATVGGNFQYWYTPGFQLKAGKTYRFSYWYVNSGYTAGTIWGMYYNTNQGQSGATAIKADIADDNTSYKKNEGDFSVPSDGVYYLAAKLNNTGFNYAGSAIDDIYLQELPDCNTATAITTGGKAVASPNAICSLPGTTTLSLTGTPAYSSLSFSWEVATGTPSSFSPAGITTKSGSYAISVGNAYYFRCKVSCAATGLWAYSDTVKVITTPITPPYVENFEGATASVNLPCASYSGGWGDTYFQYWNMKTSPFGTAGPGIVNHTTGGSKYLFAGYYLGAYASAPAAYWFTPGLALLAGKAYNFSLWFGTSGYYTSSYTTGRAELGVRVGTSQTAAAMTILAGSDTTIIPNDPASYTKLTRGFIIPTTGTYYVGIRWNPLVYFYPGIAIDDIGLEQVPPCAAKPAAGTIVASPSMICSTGTTTLSLKGTSVASDLAFQWYETDASGATLTLIPGATGVTYTTPTITTGPKYYRCMVTCTAIAAPNSDMTPVIRINVGPITPPYIEDFETATAGVNQPCASYTGTWDAGSGTSYFYYWGIKDAPSTSYYGPTVGNHTTGGKKYLSSGYYVGEYGYGLPAGNQQYWFSPPLQLTGGGMAYKCSYWYVTNQYPSRIGSTFGLYYGTSQSASAMVAMRPDITNESNDTYKQITAVMRPASSGVYYLGVKINNANDFAGYYGTAVDDIGVEQLPLCAGKPAAGTVVPNPTRACASGATIKMNLSGTSAASMLTFQWQDSSAATSGVWRNVIAGTGATIPDYVSGALTQNTWFRCIVTCPLTATPSSDTSKSVKINVGPLDPPYIEDFESSVAGQNITCASNTSSWGSPMTYNYWSINSAAYAGYYLTLDNHTPGGAKYLVAGVYLSGNNYWFTPGINLKKDSTYEFSYWYLGSGYPYGGNTTLGMYYGTSQTSGGMTTAITADRTGVNSSIYTSYIGRFIAPTTNVYYMGVKVNQISSAYYGVAIDDIGLLQLPACSGAPTAGAVAATPAMLCAAGTVKLNMDLGGVSKASGLSYKWYYYDAATATVPIDSSAELTNPLYTTTTVSATRWFDCKVKCKFTGDYTMSTRFKVDVGVITPPYIETFETAVAGVNMPCASYSGGWGSSYWYTQTAPMSGYPTADNHTPGGSSFLMGGVYLGYTYGVPGASYWFSPAIRFTGGKLYQFSFWYNGTGYSSGTSTIGAYYGTSQSAAAMTTAIGPDLVGVNITTYKQYVSRFTPTTTGNYYIGLKVDNGTGYNYPGMSFDDIGLQEVPPCSAPVVAGSVTANPRHVCSAGDNTMLELLGSTLATGLTYQWYSSSSEAGPYTLAGTGLPFTTTSLMEATWFKAVVTCSATGASDTTDAFEVGVGGFEMPYKEDFESTAAGDKPMCSDATAWSSSPYYSWTTYSGTFTTGYSNHTPSGKKFLIAGYYMGVYAVAPIYPVVTDDNYWFTPGLKFRGGYKYDLSFWYVGAQSGSTNRIGVFYGTSQSVGAMSKTILPFTKVKNTSYKQFDTTFTVATSGIYYLGFKKANEAPGTWSYYGVAFDDINLNYAPCDGMPEAGGIKSAVASGVSLCKHTAVTLMDTGATIGLVPGIKFQWQRKGIGSAAPLSWQPVVGATDTVLSSDTLIGYQYRLAVVCANTGDSAFTAAFQLPETPAHPPVAISPSTSPVVYCLGDTVSFTATNFTGGVYDWMLDSVTIPGWKFSDLGATEPGTYMVKVTSALSPCPAYSGKVKLQANDPGYKVTITVPSDSILCDGEAITLTAVASKPGVSFQWRKNNVPIPGATGNTYTVRTDGSYRVIASDGISSCPAASRNIHFTVKPNPPAVIDVPGGTLTACTETGVRLDANLGGYSYQWNRSGSPVFGWVDSSVIVRSSGVYNVKVRNADGCVSVSTDMTVSILPSPVPVIKRTDLLLETVLAYSTYQWIRNSADITPGGSGPSYTMSKHGFYQVRVTDFNNCIGISTPISVFDEDSRLDVGNVSLNSEIKVYPNPTTAKVTIDCPVGFKLTIKDISGKTVLERTDVKEVDLGNYADGVYLFMISDKDGTNILKQQRVNKVSAK